MLCFLNSLPRGAEDITRPFRLYLESFCLPSCQLKHLLSAGEHYPVPELHLWLIDDYNIAKNEISERVKKNLFLAAMFYSVYILFDDFAGSYFAGFNNQSAAINRFLKKSGDSYIASSFPPAHKTQELIKKFWGEYYAARARKLNDHTRKLKSLSKTRQQKISGKWSLAKIPAAAALMSGRGELLNDLVKLLDDIHFLVQTRQDIMNIRQDILRRYYSYPIMRVITDSGMRPDQTPDSNAILGGLILRPSIRDIAGECVEDAGKAEKDALTLGLKNFASYAHSLKKSFGDIFDLFSIRKTAAKTRGKAAGIPERKSDAVFELDYMDEVPRALKFAKSFLLSDTTFRESWEIHVWGLLNTPILTGRIFQSGVILENLCASGLNVTNLVDELCENYAKNDFHYYDEPCPLPPDIDSLGLMLRLRAYSNSEAKHGDSLSIPVKWLRANILKSGNVPVWLRNNLDSIKPREYFPEISGKNCSAAEAGLLLGLLKYNPPGFLPIIKKMAAYQLAEFIKYGVAKCVYYKPLYFYWLISEILSNPMLADFRLVPKGLIIKASEKLAKLIEKEKKERGNTAQDASFLTLTCLNKGFEQLFDPVWITQIVRSQRFDGSWNAENLYCFLVQDCAMGWYSSRLATTSYCYRALSTYMARKK